MVLPWCPNRVKVYESVQPLLDLFGKNIFTIWDKKSISLVSITATLIFSVCSLRKLSFCSSESHTPPPVPISGLQLELSSIWLWLHISNSGTVRTDTSLKIDVSSRYETCTHSDAKILLSVCEYLLEFTKCGSCMDKTSLGEKLCEPSLGEFIQFYCIITLWKPRSYKGI